MRLPNFPVWDSVANEGDAITTLQSRPIPANTFKDEGDTVTIETRHIFPQTGSGGRVQWSVGGTLLDVGLGENSLAFPVGANGVKLIAKLVCIGLNTVRCELSWHASDKDVDNEHRGNLGAPIEFSLDFAEGNEVFTTGKGTNNGDVVQTLMDADYEAAA